MIVHSGDGCESYLAAPGSYRTTLDAVIDMSVSGPEADSLDIGPTVAIASESRSVPESEEPISEIDDMASISGIDGGVPQ